MLHIYTYGAGDISRFEYLKTSADFCGLEINYITQSNYNGYFDKIKYMLNAIKDLPDNDMVCFIDGFDVLATGFGDEIVQKFKNYDCDILCGAELNCWPGQYLQMYVEMNITTGYKYLNSGGFIGYKHAIVKLYTWKSLETIADICKTASDQGYFKEYFLHHYKLLGPLCKMKLDYKAEIFQNMFSLDWNEIYFTNGRLVNSVMKTTPCFLHFNGDSWKSNEINMMPVFIEKLISSSENSNEILTLSEYNQPFNHQYFKRRQL
jgi:hypothetical protein